jgi:hypothetical protein
MGSIWVNKDVSGLVANNRRVIGSVSCLGWVEAQFVDDNY